MAYLKWGPYQMHLENYLLCGNMIIQEDFNTHGLAYFLHGYSIHH